MRGKGERGKGKGRKYYYQLPITNYQLPITNYQLPITNYQLPITNYQLPFPIIPEAVTIVMATAWIMIYQ
ncbi:hypothetical protein NIES2107_00320 [Nostoc carneum NIES-2107]|nr:hypothetical protein NIES2107_00320 [Nostoc carneum NIES-2107]